VFLKSVKMQISYNLRRKSVMGIFFLLLFLVVFNYITNMIYYDGLDATQMFNPVKLSALSSWTASSFYLMQFYPLLLVVPMACGFFNDKNARILNYMQSRVGIRNYFYAKQITVFVITFLLFTIPFLLELLIYRIIIPLCANGDPSNVEYWQTIEGDSNLFLSSIYYFSPYLYTALSILIFGLVTSIFSVFNFSVTTLPVFKYRIMTYFPVYILFFIINRFASIFGVSGETNYFLILPLYSSGDFIYPIYAVFLVALTVCSVILIEIRIHKGIVV